MTDDTPDTVTEGTSAIAPPMDPARIEAMFTRSDGAYTFARWNRPVVPVLFGVEDQTVSTFKGAIEAIVTLAGHEMADTDPELGANMMFFFLREWQELRDTPNLDRLIPDLAPLTDRLEAADATHYRAFRFDEAGGIRAAFIFLRVTGAVAELPADTLALAEATQAMLLWSDRAFAESSPLGQLGEEGRVSTILKPEIAGLIRAAYDPVLPPSATDPSHALRLYARLAAGQA
ncbi:hypothetical protein CLV77_0502 [Brevirhabdus pacifica]|nr:hypothetical protein CLV77_0502 [Brevirhabdus pacifica]